MARTMSPRATMPDQQAALVDHGHPVEVLVVHDGGGVLEGVVGAQGGRDPGLHDLAHGGAEGLAEVVLVLLAGLRELHHPAEQGDHRREGELASSTMRSPVESMPTT